jgi:hypothetical protein
MSSTDEDDGLSSVLTSDSEGPPDTDSRTSSPRKDETLSTPEAVEAMRALPQPSSHSLNGRTTLELEQLWSELTADLASIGKGVSYAQGLQKRIEEILRAIEGSDTALQESQLNKQNWFGNGMVNTKLLERYGFDLRYTYPNINAFLSVTFLRFQIDYESNEVDQEPFQQIHGDGYFTFELV